MESHIDKNDLEKIRQKTYSVSLRDGMLEILLGLLFLWYGGFLIHVLSRFTTNYPVIPFVLLFAFSAFIVEAMRRRITYPRIGRFKLIETPGILFILSWTVFIIIPFAIYIALIVGVNSETIHEWASFVPLLFGMVLLGIFQEFARKSGQGRFALIAVVCVMSGVIVSLFRIFEPRDGIVVFFTIVGGMILLSGTLNLAAFLRNTPLKEDDVSAQP